MDAGLQLEPDEPLSPELVLVLPAELRAQVLANLEPPVWPTPRPREPEPLPAPAPPTVPALAPLAPVPVSAAPPAAEDSFARSLGALVGARFAQLAVIFAIVTIVTLALSIVAHAIR